MKRITTIAVIWILTILVISCTKGAEKTYQFTIMDKNNEVIIEGSFKGNDSNGDGWIDTTELTGFSEKVYKRCLGKKVHRKGWQEYVEEKDYPEIIHTLQDLKKFKFALKKWKEGSTQLEFETDTYQYENFTVKGYLFWRKTELTENGTKAVFVNGVGDGTEGLVLCLTERENVIITIK